MSVIDINKMPDRNGQWDRYDDFYETYLVKTDAIHANDWYFVIRSAMEDEVGPFLSVHPVNPFFSRRLIRIQSRSPYHFQAYVDWSTRPISEAERNREEYPNPVDRPAIIHPNSVEFQEYRAKDVNGNVYQNSAKYPLEPEPIDVSSTMFDVTAFASTWTKDQITKNNTRNDGVVTMTDGYAVIVIGQYDGRIRNYQVTGPDYENGFRYYTHRCQIHIDEVYQWKDLRIDQGPFYLDGSSNQVEFTIKDADGADIPAPTDGKLDGSGGALAAGTDPEILEFDKVKDGDWSDLPFFT